MASMIQPEGGWPQPERPTGNETMDEIRRRAEELRVARELRVATALHEARWPGAPVVCDTHRFSSCRQRAREFIAMLNAENPYRGLGL